MFGKRIFVVCPSFHGATLLARLLGAHPGVTALGDTYPKKHLIENCGCGRHVAACNFWNHVDAAVETRVGQDAFYRYWVHPPGARTLFGRSALWVGSSSAIRHSVSEVNRKRFLSQYEEFLGGVYEAQNNPGRVFVDGVKSVARVRALLAFKPELVDGVIHLTRDAGDFAKSRARKHPGNVEFSKSLLQWRAYHRLAERLRQRVPYIHVRYADLANETQSTLDAIFEFMGESMAPLAQLTTSPDEWHFVGNASLRSFSGQIKISRHKLSAAEQTMKRIFLPRRCCSRDS